LAPWDGIGEKEPSLVFCSIVGTPLSPRNLARSFAVLIKKTKVPEISLHGLRHTSATLMLKENVPAKVVSERLGHSKIGITLDTYSHVLPDMQREAADKISQVIKAKLPRE
jgi:integrase